MKKVLSLIISFIVVLSITFISFSNTDANEIDIHDYDAVSNLMKKDKTTQYTTYKSFEKEKTFDYDEYNDDYAGSYVKDGKLVILKTRNNNTISTFSSNQPTIDNIVKFSMNHLNDTMNDINIYKKYNEDSYIAKQFNLYWIDIENNRIVVEFNNLNKYNIDLFKKNVLDDECITFKQIEDKPKEEVSVKPGSKIVIGSGVSSVGYRATRNGVKGIVISGHSGKKGDKVYSGNQLIGTVQVSQNRGSIDAAFVQTNSNAVLSNSVYDGTLSNNTQNLNVGVNVYKKGFTTGTTTGKVTKNNASVTFHGVTLFGLVGANYSSAPGDSGGLVFFKVPGENLINTVGIHKGTVGNTKFYSKASEVNRIFGLKRY